MGIYDTLGKGLITLFIGLTGVLSPAPLPKPEPVVLAPIEDTIPLKTLPPVITPLPKNEIPATSTKQKFISIYLNYPEKVSIPPAKTFNENFEKIFQYGDTEKKNIELIHPVLKETIPTKTPEKTATQQNDIYNSIVNIYCTIKNGNSVKAITGSGVIIDSRGLVLTNAHVGEYPLLQGSSIAKNMSCSIRIGSPINTTYGVKTVYISKNWITKNYRNISQINFSETGEEDIAILQILDKQTGNAPKRAFNRLNTASGTVNIGDSISIASYPADLFGTRGITALLSVKVENLRVYNAFSFINSHIPDLLETTDSTETQHGSSGGALLNSSGDLAGIIAITVNGNSPGTKHARALTIQHINDTIQKDTGYNLNSFISQDLATINSQFENDRQILVNKLIEGSAALFFSR